MVLAWLDVTEKVPRIAGGMGTAGSSGPSALVTMPMLSRWFDKRPAGVRVRRLAFIEAMWSACGKDPLRGADVTRWLVLSTSGYVGRSRTSCKAVGKGRGRHATNCTGIGAHVDQDLRTPRVGQLGTVGYVVMPASMPTVFQDGD